MKKQIFSGIQPTGQIHLGNYFGAIENWVALQSEYNCAYCVVDYHAITMPYQPKKLREAAWDLAFSLLALGIKPENLFIQSMVPEHTELTWLLNAFCPFGELSRMTQFKDKKELLEEKDNTAFVSAGLFNYPILQAADILIYKADLVPVGKDQEQHLELSRGIAQRSNQALGKEFFPIPQALFTETAKIMSLAEPKRKMSKSLGEKHYISVFEEEASLRKKIKSAVTDTGEQLGEGEMSPGVANLFSLLKAAKAQDIQQELLAEYQAGTLRYAALKEALTDVYLPFIADFRARKAAILAEKKDYKYKIKLSAQGFRQRAKEHLAELKELMGLQPSAK